ncbi:YciI family protein [Blastopirellula sp. JC732]|uniref:YciI family protein n=1 Tax=Blastopirellula sediminis TaxID=2894196 RepID=A0A9X1MQU1_9BACT|nr:YciI family protein [Blastopirellula sediminis]MCC9605656.1 YciI family protein [Blastopirellula sediminis]MCC9631044.1 YciI family protein [Blastopirellula sediminis]
MKYVCLGYIDQKAYAEIPPDVGQKLMDECFAYDDELRRGGHFLGGEALGWSHDAVTLRAKDGNVEVTDGPFSETKETLGGILLLEARDMNHAIALMSKHPGVKMGPFEIRPADETVNALITARNEKVKQQLQQQQ